MSSKTPQFDKALDEYYSKLELDDKKGQWRTCRFSGEKFYVRSEDIGFYKKIRILLPTLSPRERIRLRLSFWNSYNLYPSISSFSGKKIISQYPPGSTYKIYEHQMWFGGEWDPFAFGRTYDSSRLFFDQSYEFQISVPRPNLFVDSTSVNSDYTNDATNLKNCYLVFNSMDAEDCSYSISLVRSRNCTDCFDIYDSDQCYECFLSKELYNCYFVENSKNCMNSFFLYDCRGCTDCFGGTNMRNKKYYFFNEPLTKDDYEKCIKNINLGDRNVLDLYKSRFEKLKSQAIHKKDHNDRAINSSGDYIRNSTNCFSCFYSEDSQNVAYGFGAISVRDSYDVGGENTELSYETGWGTNGFGLLFSRHLENCSSMEYSDLCFNCHDCFGCIGLFNKSFCVFNKQYLEADYCALVDKIKSKMLQDAEYGEFFPSRLSPFPYNISIVTSYAGYEDLDLAKSYGYRFEEIKDSLDSDTGEIIDSADLPRDIKDVTDNVLNKIILDSKNKRKFRYTRAELNFYRKNNLPLPLEHYSVRLAQKRKKFGPLALKSYTRMCAKCGISTETSYSPDRPEKNIYCENCYLAYIG